MKMILKNDEDKVVASVTISNGDGIQPSINIRRYSVLLLKKTFLQKSEQVVNDFEKINEFGDWVLSEDKIIKELRSFIKEVAERHNLNYSEEDIS